MRQVVLDTETTGLEPEQGHRIIEIGCVELLNRRPTNNTYHQYLQPDRDVDTGAQEVHGIDNAFLADKPRFADIAEDFLAFVAGAELIIHNAAFDVGFVNYELQWMGYRGLPLQEQCKVVDTLEMARKLHPGQRNSLDALCKRYQIDNASRTLHGALLDAQILADVYLAMTGGQVSLGLDSAASAAATSAEPRRLSGERPALAVVRADAEEQAAHEAMLEKVRAAAGGSCLWDRRD